MRAGAHPLCPWPGELQVLRSWFRAMSQWEPCRDAAALLPEALRELRTHLAQHPPPLLAPRNEPQVRPRPRGGGVGGRWAQSPSPGARRMRRGPSGR